ncbi:MAG: thioredoxin reductase/bacterioferritin-associated ferredoxin [Parasphingorhabdus sp.]|jgi:thioredoxin reductase/bacterioferritin-associated ferredoxin
MNPDVVIVGAGPAGMSAALALQEHGAVVRVVDEQSAPGGQVYRAVERVSANRPDSLPLFGNAYAEGLKLCTRFSQSGINCSYSTSVWDISGQGESPRIGLSSTSGAELLNPRHIILATGAMERPTPFPGWTLPGVMSVGAAQTMLKESALIPEGKVILAGTGPLLYLYATQMLAAGVKPYMILDSAAKRVHFNHWLNLLSALVADSSALMKGVAWLRQIGRAGIKHHFGLQKISATGNDRVERVSFTSSNLSSSSEVDVLLAHDGVVPNSHLALAAGCKHVWSEKQCYWAPKLTSGGASTVAGISIAGDADAIYGAEGAELKGRHIGHQVANQLGLLEENKLKSLLSNFGRDQNKITRVRQFIDAHYQPLAWFKTPPDDQTTVCRCEEVTAGELRKVVAQGCMGPNQAKAFTRCGMGPCLGRLCGNTVSQLMSQQTGRSVSDIGHYNIRPPVRPLTVGQLVNLEIKETQN